MISRVILPLLIVWLLGACALTTDEIDLRYESKMSANIVPGANTVTVQVNVTDGRTSNLNKVSVKKNGYGIEMAPIISKQSLSDLVKSALEEELVREGFKIGPGQLYLDAEIQKFYNDFKVGFFSGDAASEVTIAAQVKAPDGRILYARTFSGENTEGGVMLANGSNAKISLQKALGTSVSRLVSDPNFTRALLTVDRRAPERFAS